MTDLYDRFAAIFGADALNTLAIHWLPSILLAVAVMVVFWIINAVVRRLLTMTFERVEFDETAGAFVQTIVRLALWTIGGLTALAQLGVDVASILGSLGILGLTVGFAAQNTLSNVISGLFILWDRPFVIGDLIEVNGQYGRVARITMRSTRVVTPDGRMLAIPNSVIADATVASYTNFPNLRLDIDVTIAVTESIARTREVLLGLVRSDPAYLDDPAPVVVVTALGDYNVTVELRAWLRDEKSHVNARATLRERAKDALDAAGVDMPFETLALQPVTVVSSGPALTPEGSAPSPTTSTPPA